MDKGLLKKVKNTLSTRKIDESNSRVVLVVFFSILMFSIFYHVIFARRIIPGLKIGSVYVGGMTYSDALSALQQNEKTLGNRLVITVEGKPFEVMLDDIYLVYDWEGSVARAFEVGRTGNLLVDTKDKIMGLLRTLYVGAFYDYDDDALSTLFSQIKGEVNIEEQDAGVEFTEDGDLVIVYESQGKKIVDDVLYSMVIESFDRMDYSSKKVPTKTINPAITKEDVEKKYDELKNIVSNSITIKGESEEWLLETEQLINFVTIKKEGNKLEVGLNEPRFEIFSETVARETNQLPRGKVTTDENGNVLTFEITQEGTELNSDRFVEDFKEVLYSGGSEVSLPMTEVFGPTTKEKYGIYELLGEGESTFKGSISSRIHNLTLAAEKTNGVLVAPDSIYSLNDSIGDISIATGYYTAYIIKGDRTILGSGGGVCQTSTTLFRAVLNSGLPIVMRYPHAYRVSYYEQDMPVGFDAAIFQPSWDFRFKNDTESYVLVTSEYIPSEYKLIFRLYGNSDGRTVEITEPVVTNQTPPPPALYQDDPTLPKGTVKQVDWSAWGARVRFTRTVKLGDEVLFEDVYNSTYQPWKAVFLVGTKE